MIDYEKIKENITYRKVDIENYFLEKDKKASFVVTKILEEYADRNVFALINQDNILEIFFRSENIDEVNSSSSLQLDFLAYYKGVSFFAEHFR